MFGHNSASEVEERDRPAQKSGFEYSVLRQPNAAAQGPAMDVRRRAAIRRGLIDKWSSRTQKIVAICRSGSYLEPHFFQ
jgi:hypothetical protein